jgi:hypothetical protein
VIIKNLRPQKGVDKMKTSFAIFVLAQINPASLAQMSEQTSGATSTRHSVSSIKINSDWICTACS